MDFLTLFSSLSCKFITFLFLFILLIFSVIYMSSCSSLFFNVFVHYFLSSYCFVLLKYSVYSLRWLTFFTLFNLHLFPIQKTLSACCFFPHRWSAHPLLPCPTFLVPFGIDCEIFLGRLPSSILLHDQCHYLCNPLLSFILQISVLYFPTLFLVHLSLPYRSHKEYLSVCGSDFSR